VPLSYLNLPVEVLKKGRKIVQRFVLKDKKITTVDPKIKKKFMKEFIDSLMAYDDFNKLTEKIIEDFDPLKVKNYFIEDLPDGLKSCYTQNVVEKNGICIIKLVKVLSENLKNWNQSRIDIINGLSVKEDINRDEVLGKFDYQGKKCFDFPKNYSKVQKSNDFSDLVVLKNDLITLKDCINTLEKMVVHEGNKQKRVLAMALKEKIDEVYKGPFPKIFKKLYSNSSSIDEIINLTSSLNTDQLLLLEKYRKKKIFYNPHEKKSLSSLTTIELKSYLNVLERKTLQSVSDSYKYKLQILPFD
jgi:hypothetical protein